jgi:hypothetical protein
MSLIRIERNPTRRQLRQFGAIGAVLLFTCAWWQRDSAWTAGALLALGAVVLGCTVSRPQLFHRPFVWLSAILLPVGLVVSEIVLAAVFFLVFTPIGLCFRLLRRDALNRKFDAARATYWEDSPQPRSAESYFRQY